MFNRMQTSNPAKGFTLLELLIVIAVLAVLATIVVIVLNPAETLAKSRDTQRISDLSTMKSALALYMTTVSSPELDGIDGGTSINDNCKGGTGSTDTVYLSSSAITDTTAPSPFDLQATSTSASSTLVNGTGWIPVNLSDITGGSPISNMPLDPTNSAANGSSTVGTLTNAGLIYRYACQKSPLGFEINATLESTTYTVDDAKATKDGGNNSALYEVGTALDILPATDNF